MQTLSLKYSRDNEEESDRYGLVYLTEAGYQAESALSLLKLMRRYEFYSNSVPSYFLTHPGTDDRIRYIDGLLHTVYADNRGKTEIVGPFRRIKMMLMTGGELESRVRYFEEELRKDPSDVDSLYGMGVVQARRGRYNESLETLRRALSFAPQDPDILRELGAACFKMGKYVEGLPYLSQALEIDKDDIGALSWLGNTYEALGIYDKALECYQTLKTLDPADNEIYYGLGIIYGKMRDLIPHHYYMGLYFQKQGKKDSSLFHFNEGLKRCTEDNPFCSDIRKEMGTASKEPRKRRR
jgi:predicted Zn-dependent protease